MKTNNVREKSNLFNALIIADDAVHDNLVLLLNKEDLREIVYNNEAYSFAQCYELDENGIMERAGDILKESDFEDMFYEADETDREDGIEYYETYYDDEPQAFVKADWVNHDHYIRYESEHGINTTHYDFDEDQKVYEGECYEALDCILADYPHTHHQRFFKFVSNEGETFFIKMTQPFFLDEFDYEFELISEEEFKKHDEFV